MNRKRNGELDVLRLVFCIFIALKHIPAELRVRGWFCGAGWIGVEFFFLLSGLLLADSALRAREQIKEEEIGDQCWKYIVRKYIGLFKYFIIAIVIRIGLLLPSMKGPEELIRKIINSVPLLLFISEPVKMQGDLYYKGNWYLSVLLAGSFILYFLVLKYGRTFTIVGAPVISVLITGYLMSVFGHIHPTHETALINGGLLRGISVMCLGILAYEIACQIRKKKIDSKPLSIIKYLLYLIVICYAFGKADEKLVYPMVLLCGAAVALSYSETGICQKGTKLTALCGKYSLMVYLTHGLVLEYLQSIHESFPPSWSFTAVYMISALIFAGIFQIFCDFLYSHTGKRKETTVG